MIIKRFLFCLIFTSLVFSCGTVKNKKVYSLEKIKPFAKCDSLLQLIDVEDNNHVLKNINNLSYSTAYIAIHTKYRKKTDTLEKELIRSNYETKIHDLVTFSFPKIEATNDSLILSLDYQAIGKTYKHLYLKDKGYEEFLYPVLTNTIRSNKQLFIRVSAVHYEDTIRTNVTFYIFSLNPNKLLYEDRMRYNCDIRDYDSLEKVISYGLLKIKESFE